MRLLFSKRGYSPIGGSESLAYQFATRLVARGHDVRVVCAWPTEKEEVAYWLHEVLGRLGITLLFVEHGLRFASRLATRMVALDRGEKVAEGAPDEVKRRPEVARAYLGDGCS